MRSLMDNGNNTTMASTWRRGWSTVRTQNTKFVPAKEASPRKRWFSDHLTGSKWIPLTMRRDDFCSQFVFSAIVFSTSDVPLEFSFMSSISLIIEFMVSFNILEYIYKIYHSDFNVFACQFHHLISGHISIFFSSQLQVIFSCCLARRVIFYWMLSNGHFTVLGIRFCLIPGESVGLCSGSQLLGNSLIFSGLAFQLCPEQHLVEDQFSTVIKGIPFWGHNPCDTGSALWLVRSQWFAAL